MADTFVDIRLHISDNATSVAERLAKAADNRHGGASALLREIQAILAGTRQGKIVLGPIDSATDTDVATADITITHANVGTDGVTIGGVEFTEGTDWDAGANATEDATALAAAINAHASLKGIVSASSAAGVVTLTYYKAGREGSLITITTDDATAYDLSAAALGGASTTQQEAPRTWSFGVA